MKLRRVTVDKVIEEVPKKQMSKSLNSKLLSAGRKAIMLSKFKPQQNIKPQDNVQPSSKEENNDPPNIEEPIAIKLELKDTNTSDDDPLNRKIS